MLAILSGVGIILQMPVPYYLGLAAAWCMMLYHYCLIRGRTREGCFKAFRHNNWVGLAIFLGIFFSYPLRLPRNNFV